MEKEKELHEEKDQVRRPIIAIMGKWWWWWWTKLQLIYHLVHWVVRCVIVFIINSNNEREGEKCSCSYVPFDPWGHNGKHLPDQTTLGLRGHRGKKVNGFTFTYWGSSGREEQ